MVYLDNNATTRPAPEARAAMAPFEDEDYGNPSSAHAFGGRARHALDRARDQVAALLGARPGEIVFTSGGTESNNAAIRGVLDALPAKRHLIVSRVEHPSVLRPAERLQKSGWRVTFLRVDAAGLPDLEELRASLADDTALVSLMAANNETGVRFPLEAIAGVVKGRNVLLHCDAVQAAGRIPIDVGRLPVDLVTVSGHKLHGPKGIGALYVRRRTPFVAWLAGGHQERDRRAGTENVAGAAGLGTACVLARAHLAAMPEVAALRDRLEETLLRAIPGARVLGHREARVPNTTSLLFPGLQADTLLLLLSEEGVCASSGSACATGSLEPSHVLQAMGVPPRDARSVLRFSLSRYTTPGEIDRALEIIPAAAERARELAGAAAPPQPRAHGSG